MPNSDMEQVSKVFGAAPKVPAAAGPGFPVSPDFATPAGAAPEPKSSSSSPTGHNPREVPREAGGLRPPSAMPLTGTLPVGLWYTKVYPTGAPANGANQQLSQEPAAPGDASADRSLVAMAEDDAFRLSEERQLLEEGRRSRSRASDTTPLLRVNRADLRALQNNSNLPYALRCSIINFLKRFKHSHWMQWQKDYPARIGITVAAQWCDFSKSMALCGVNNWLCQHPDYCPRCSVRLRAKPAAREYRDCFEQGHFWYAISPSFELNPNRAGLRFVVQKADQEKHIPAKVSRFNPYRGRQPGVPLTSDAHLLDGDDNPVIACFKTIFNFAEKLVDASLVGGALAQREVAWHFQPHRVTPNGHLLVNTPVPITFDAAKEMLLRFDFLYAAQPQGRRLWPDLHIEPLLSQGEIDRWIFYMFKPMDYVTGYLRAVRAGADVAALNLQIDDRVFQGGSKILSVRGPRRYGNLRCNVDGYIGGGSITAWRKEQTERRKAERERLGLNRPKPPPLKPRLARVIDQESDRIDGGNSVTQRRNPQ